MTASNPKANLENTLSVIAGEPVEITIRGDRNFTWYMESTRQEAVDKLVKFAKGDPRVSVEVMTDPEVGTCVYLDVAG